MKLLELTDGSHVMVDDEDFERLARHKWTANVEKGRLKPLRREPRKQGGKKIYLHREVAGAKRPGDRVTFCTSDERDFRKGNLTKQGYRKGGRGVSRYRGVSRDRNGNWEARIVTPTGERKYLGTYEIEEAAAKAYNQWAKRYYRNMAHLNDVPDEIVPMRFRQWGLPSRTNGKLGYRGVNRKNSGFEVRVWHRGKLLRRTGFKTPEEAAAAYNELALQLRGPNTPLNVIGQRRVA